MGKEKFKMENKEVLDSFLLQIPEVKPGKMFGYPAYYIHNKLFACVYGDGVGIKISEDKSRDLLDKEGIIPFQPMGRPKMREWIQISRDNPDDYLKDKEIFNISLKFVSTLRKK